MANRKIYDLLHAIRHSAEYTKKRRLNLKNGYALFLFQFDPDNPIPVYRNTHVLLGMPNGVHLSGTTQVAATFKSYLTIYDDGPGSTWRGFPLELLNDRECGSEDSMIETLTDWLKEIYHAMVEARAGLHMGIAHVARNLPNELLRDEDLPK